MKDETIRPGDIVMIIKPRSCCGSGRVGLIYRVRELNSKYFYCKWCGADYSNTLRAMHSEMEDGAEVSRLKKIHPTALPETVDAGQEVEA